MRRRDDGSFNTENSDKKTRIATTDPFENNKEMQMCIIHVTPARGTSEILRATFNSACKNMKGQNSIFREPIRTFDCKEDHYMSV